MRTQPASFGDHRPGSDVSIEKPVGIARRIGVRILHEAREALPPTIFFFVGFNFIVFTTNLLLADYAIAVSSFMLATVAALVGGQSGAGRQCDAICETLRSGSIAPADPVQDSLLLGHCVLRTPARAFHAFLRHGTQSAGRFHRLFDHNLFVAPVFAVSLWIFVLFLIYVTASEVSHLFGPGELRRLFFTSRPSELQLNRRQRIRELLRLSRLMDAHSIDEFRNPASPAHRELIGILQPLARK